MQRLRVFRDVAKPLFHISVPLNRHRNAQRNNKTRTCCSGKTKKSLLRLLKNRKRDLYCYFIYRIVTKKHRARWRSGFGRYLTFTALTLHGAVITFCIAGYGFCLCNEMPKYWIVHILLFIIFSKCTACNAIQIYSMSISLPFLLWAKDFLKLSWDNRAQRKFVTISTAQNMK